MSEIEPSRRAARYAAFISYSHAVDGQLAPSLESALERFAKRWYRIRALRVFRDDTSLSATPALWSAIQAALDDSGAFILMASPAAASSQWVARELEHWLTDRSPDRLLLVLTDGDLHWDEERPGFDWETTTAVPRVLDGVFAEEPRWTDLRWARTREQLSLRDPRFREAVADIAAPLHGRQKDELIGEEIRQHRRTVRLAASAVAALALLTVVAAVAAVLAIRGQATARQERDRAQAQARLATSRQLAAESESALRDGSADLAILLATEAARFESTPEARGSLFAALNAVPRVERMLRFPGAELSADGRTLGRAEPGRIEVRALEPDGAVQRYPAPDEIFGFGLSADGATVAVGDETGAVTIQGAATDKSAVRFPGPPEGIGEEGPFQGTRFALARRHRLVAWNGVDVSLWNGRRRRSLASPVGPQPGEWQLAFSSDDGLLAAASDSVGTVVVWELTPDGAPIGTPEVFEAGSGSGFMDFGEGVASIAFSPTERGLLAVGGFDGSVAFWDAETGTRLSSTGDGSGAAEVRFSPDGRRLVAADDRRIRLWDVAERRVMASFPGYKWAGSPAFLADSRRLAAFGSGVVALWDPAAPPFQLARRLAGPTDGINDLAYDSSGRTLATLSFDEIRLWDTKTLRPIGEPLAPGQSVDLAFDRDGRSLVAWSSIPPRARIWNLETGRERDVRVPAVDTVVAGPQGFVAAGTDDDGLQVTTVGAAQQRRTLPRSEGVTPPIAVSPDGRTVVGALPPTPGGLPGAARPLRLWSADPPRVVRASLPSSTIGGVQFSPDGRVLATADDHGAVQLWDPRSGKQRGALETGDFVSALAFDRDRRLATVSNEDLDLWDLRRRQPLATETFATRTGARFEGQEQLAFAPDGRSLAVVGLDARPLIFDVDPASWLETACRIANRNLTRAEWERFVGPGFPYERTCPLPYGE